MNSNW